MKMTFRLYRRGKTYYAQNNDTGEQESLRTKDKATANRTLTREANEHLMEQMAERLKAQPAKYALRKQLAEHPFGTIKRWFGYTHFTLKGLTKVRAEWSLITLAYNLKRVLNLVSFEQLMAAVA